MIPVDQDAQLIADWLAIADAFDEVARNEIWVLYERNRDVALPGSAGGVAAWAADEVAGKFAGELVVVDDLDAGDERGVVALGLLHEAARAGGQIVGHPGGAEREVVVVDDVEVGAQAG